MGGYRARLALKGAIMRRPNEKLILWAVLLCALYLFYRIIILSFLEKLLPC